MWEYSYINIVIVSLLRGMNSDSPWRQYYASNRITGSAFWFCFNLFGRFVLMRMFLESIAVSQVRRAACFSRMPLTPCSMGCCRRSTWCRCVALKNFTLICLSLFCSGALTLRAVHHAAVLRQSCREDMLRCCP